MAMRNATAVAVSQQVGQTTSGTKLFSETELRAEFTAKVLQYTPRQLAKFSGATPEGARHWLDGSRSANLTNTLNIALSIPAVSEWIVYEKLGYSRAAQANSYDTVLQGLYAVAAGNGPDAMKARWAIARLNSRDDDPPKRDERDTVTVDIFTRRRWAS